MNIPKKAFSGGIHIISPEIFGLMKEEGNFQWWMFTWSWLKIHTITAFDYSSQNLLMENRKVLRLPKIYI